MYMSFVWQVRYNYINQSSCVLFFYFINCIETSCCSWAGGNYAIYIISWIFYAWIIVSGLYAILVKRAEMTWVSSSETVTTVATSSSIGYNIFMYIIQMGAFTVSVVIVPAIIGNDCQWYYC